MPRPRPSVFFVSSEFHFADRFPRWKSVEVPTDASDRHRAKAQFARELEEVGFDAVFVADFAGLNRTQIRYSGPRSFEPVTLAAFLAAHTERIGLVITLSTQFSEPYTVARELTSLDRLSGGRAGWNVVTSFNGESNYGYDRIPSPQKRYERAREFLGVTKALWHSWDPDAIVADRASEVYVDTDRVRDINWAGANFRVGQALDLPPAPQTFPLIAQAGASDIGIDFAAEAAEVVFVACPDFDSGRAYYRQLKDAVVDKGRRADDLKVLPGIRIYLGDDETEAKTAYLDELTALDLERAREAIRYEVPGLDLSDLGLDDAIPLDRFPDRADLEKHGRRVSRALIYRKWVEEGDYATLREFLVRYATSFGHFQIVGTAATAADTIEAWISEGAADGFILLGGSSFERIRRDLIPLLQERGIFGRPDPGRRETLRARLGTTTPGLIGSAVAFEGELV
ncbi:NtaA/DmoA family FMN-dependent monooxygenase [Aldersonia sp. NBC_00410]|uniref:NtaA/DmoA family FMN-dependent monooxygenase n=1 Tax=Aldersonia sp. NBC_00410 TaxID=2975954 RepID=UPI00225AF93A|nr:NtaA/DmoA family FMN-dependent monooxygenase [Aldersonia sp. NBC_00410]MCX5044161.1 NtaA/DmoA family FMN-dependent monooxygenase [Aldersonia sp. NBC_00410]